MTTPPGGVRAGRAATLIGRWDKGDYDAIRFIQVRDTVHVIAAGEDRPVTAIDRLIDDAEALAQLRFMLGEEWSVCGVRFVRHRGGFEQGARLLSHFPDELLCGPLLCRVRRPIRDHLRGQPGRRRGPHPARPARRRPGQQGPPSTAVGRTTCRWSRRRGCGGASAARRSWSARTATASAASSSDSVTSAPSAANATLRNRCTSRSRASGSGSSVPAALTPSTLAEVDATREINTENGASRG